MTHTRRQVDRNDIDQKAADAIHILHNSEYDLVFIEQGTEEGRTGIVSAKGHINITQPEEVREGLAAIFETNQETDPDMETPEQRVERLIQEVTDEVVARILEEAGDDLTAFFTRINQIEVYIPESVKIDLHTFSEIDDTMLKKLSDEQRNGIVERREWFQKVMAQRIQQAVIASLEGKLDMEVKIPLAIIEGKHGIRKPRFSFTGLGKKFEIGKDPHVIKINKERLQDFWITPKSEFLPAPEKVWIDTTYVYLKTPNGRKIGFETTGPLEVDALQLLAGNVKLINKNPKCDTGSTPVMWAEYTKVEKILRNGIDVDLYSKEAPNPTSRSVKKRQGEPKERTLFVRNHVVISPHSPRVQGFKVKITPKGN